jgi:hypothetical protein
MRNHPTDLTTPTATTPLLSTPAETMSPAMLTDMDTEFPPGTVTIEDCWYKPNLSSVTRLIGTIVQRNKLILQPRPSDEPEQPLNWSRTRKAINYALVCAYALMTFVLYGIPCQHEAAKSH